jgi:hypothetical protein
MSMYAVFSFGSLFWIGFLTLATATSALWIRSGITVVSLALAVGIALMFVGSKIGREFLGISA